MYPLEYYLGVYFPRCFATRKIKKTLVSSETVPHSNPYIILHRYVLKKSFNGIFSLSLYSIDITYNVYDALWMTVTYQIFFVRSSHIWLIHSSLLLSLIYVMSLSYIRYSLYLSIIYHIQHFVHYIYLGSITRRRVLVPLPSKNMSWKWCYYHRNWLTDIKSSQINVIAWQQIMPKCVWSEHTKHCAKLQNTLIVFKG